MAYRHDEDLEFLRELSSQELNDLVQCLTKDKDGDSLWTEELTGNESYKKYYPDHAKYWQLIAGELQCFGANSVATIFRGGKGVLYREVLYDVCDKLSIKQGKEETTLDVENKVLTKFVTDAFEKMTESDRAEFAKTTGLDGLKSFTPNAVAAAALLIFKAGGLQSFKLTLVIANAISRSLLGYGLAFAGNAALVRAASLLTGPIGWALTGAWTAVDVAGPAYRVTIPAVVQVALLRKRLQVEKEGLVKDIEKELGEAF